MEGILFYYDWEVALMEAVQSHLGAFGTALASFITMFGEEMVMIAILGFLYWCYDKKAAKTIGMSIMVGILVNPLLKNIALRRRPYFDHPGIKCLKPVDSGADIYDISAQGYSFPSGHSTNSVILYGSFPVIWKKRIFYIIAVILPLLVGFSRVALGVHYPTDVLVGWLCGTMILLVISYLQQKVKNENLFHLIVFLLVLPGIFYCWTSDYFTGLGLMAGFFLGTPFEEKYVCFERSTKPVAVILRVLGGFAIYFGLNAALKMPFPKEFLENGSLAASLVRTLRYTVVSFVLFAIYPMLFGKLKILGGRRAETAGQ